MAGGAGSVRRVPAADIEALVVRSVREHLKPAAPIDDRSLIDTHVTRVEVQPEQLVIHLARAKAPDRQRADGDNILMSGGARDRQRGVGRFFCPRGFRRNTLVRYARRPARC